MAKATLCCVAAKPEISFSFSAACNGNACASMNRAPEQYWRGSGYNSSSASIQSMTSPIV
jgi:hypothetical protein